MELHRICDSYVDDYARLQPITATDLGIPGHDDQLPDLSPEGYAERAELAANALRAATAAEPSDDSERDAKAVFTERLGLEVELHDAGLQESALNVIASPPQSIRMAFDLMATDTPEAWATIAKRLAKVPDALAGFRTSLLRSVDRGTAPAARQATKVAEQCDSWATSFFTGLVAGSDATGPLRADLDAGARVAAQSYADFARFLREELLPKAPTKDAVGEDVYRLWSREYLGAKIDLREAYEWGWEEFTRLETEQREVANRIKPGAGLAEAAAALDEDPRYLVRGRTEFRDWMQRLSDQALADVRGVYFDIPDPIMTLDCRIAPTGGAVGAYYTNPSDDFSRPGTMWWGLPPDKHEFPTWREVSVVYHEGVPGHHLQIATATIQTSLNRFQRLLSWVPAYAEGWALYAERLMREFGYLDDDGNLFGMLNESLFRAGRVIIDIGMHLELEIPRGAGFHDGERWTPELGLEFMLTRTVGEEAQLVDEVDRYLGWPGQAPAYKLGERLWLAAREDARRHAGADFDLKEFHMRALRMGQMGLDTLRSRLAAL